MDILLARNRWKDLPPPLHMVMIDLVEDHNYLPDEFMNGPNTPLYINSIDEYLTKIVIPELEVKKEIFLYFNTDDNTLELFDTKGCNPKDYKDLVKCSETYTGFSSGQTRIIYLLID